MSNYSVTTNFAGKDQLASGNPLKVILGAQLTTEFNNIAIAIGTKLDGANAVITGTAGVAALTVNTPLSPGALVVKDQATGFHLVEIVGSASIPNSPVLFVSQASTVGGSGEALFVVGPGAGTGNAAAALVFGGSPTLGDNSEWFSQSGTTQFMALRGTGGLVVGPLGTADPGAGGINVSGGYQVNGALQSQQVASSINAANVALTSTALTNTPLSVPVVPGTYLIDIFINANGTTTGTQGLKFGVTGGTATLATVALGTLIGNVAGAAQNTEFANLSSFGTISVANTVDSMVIRFGVVVSAGGTLVLQAAQNSASANATNLLKGSALVATKVG